jgi:thymidylate synthase
MSSASRDNVHPEQQYLDLLRDILGHGEKQTDKGTGDVTHSVFGRQLRFDLSKGFPLLTTKKVYWKGVVQELYWFLSGQSNIKYLVDNNVHIWDDYPYRIYHEKMVKGELPEMTKDEFIARIANDAVFAKKYGELPHIYGELWRRWPAKNGRTVDQVQWVVDDLKKDPDAHNALVSSWNPEYLYEMALPNEAARFPICHNMYQANVKNGKLSLHLYQRSADIFLGVPFNIASYALLAIILAQVTGNKPGEFIHTFGDVHIYENHMAAVKEQLTREPKPLPSITLDPSVKTIDDFRPEHAVLAGYDPHPAIKAELAVVGGIVTDSWKEFTAKKKASKQS